MSFFHKNRKIKNPSRRKYFLLFLLVVFVLTSAGYCFIETEFVKAVGAPDLWTADNPTYEWFKGEGSCGLSLTCWTAWLADGILWLFSWFVWLGGNLLNISIDLATKQGYTKSPIVQIGWPIIRDLANMFFALILLVIAFATILRLESYGMKNTLAKLVIAALLINFSLVIGGVIIDASNVVTRYFLEGHFQIQGTGAEADVSTAILQSIGLHKYYETSPNAAPETRQLRGDQLSFTTVFLNMLLGIIFMLVTAFVLFAASVLFYIRLIALWILLIFAPLAWIGMILPATRSIWTRWWNEFGKWVIFAPVYAFFIYLTVAVLQKGIITSPYVSTSGGLALSKFTADINLVGNYVVMIIFLVAGLIFARQSGIVGASAMVNLGTSMRKMTTGAIGRRIDRGLARQRLAAPPVEDASLARRALFRMQRGIGFLSPTATKKAWQERQARIESQIYPRATASIHDTMNWAFSRGRDRTNFEEVARQNEVSRLQKEEATAGRTSERLNVALDNAIANRDTNRAEAIIRLMFDQNDQNEMLKYRHTAVTPENLKGFLRQTFEQIGLGDQQAAKVAGDLGNIAFEHGNHANFGMTTYDAANNRWEWTDMPTQYNIASRKASNMEAQQKMRTWHWNSLYQENANGTTGPMHEGGQALLNSLTAAEVGQVSRARRDFIDRSIVSLDEVVHHAQTAAIVPEQRQVIMDFARQIFHRKTGEDINNITDARLMGLSKAYLRNLSPGL